MQNARLLSMIDAVDWMSTVLGRYVAELGQLSPAEIEIKLGVLMAGSKAHERLSALLEYLDSLPANLRLQMRYERGTGFWDVLDSGCGRA